MSKITLHIKDLEFFTIIGILEKERTTPQKVVINAKFKIKYKKDKLVDYVQICELIKETFNKKKFITVEESLLHVSKKLYKNFSLIKNIDIEILKPNALNFAKVGASYTKKY
ncbi:MAG: dihydroneopterin aldolase [Campylobacteraceae bacterium]